MLLNLCAAPSFAAPTTATRAATGEVTFASGRVAIDGAPAVSGQTLFSGSLITTAEGSLLTLGLGNLARLELSAETSLKLDFSAPSVSGLLSSGQARLSIPPGLHANIVTANAVVVTDASQPAVFTVEVEPLGATVSVERGRVEMRAAGEAQTVIAGEILSTSDGSQSQPPLQRGFSGGKRVGVVIGIAATIAVLIIALTGGDDGELPVRDCGPIVPSGVTDNPCP
jgi:ferric-dicitrate binding protein FerR (iron transport regulator)